MKKLIYAILFLPGLAWASYQPVTGSTITAVNPVGGALTVITSTTGVNASTIAVMNAGGTKLLVTPDSIALPANQSVNVSQINAVTPLMGNGATGTGSQRVTIASDNTPFTVILTSSGVNGSTVTAVLSGAIPTGTNSIGNIGTVTTLTGITNALPAGTNNLGTVTGSTLTLQGSNGAPITATAGALDMNIKSGSIANTGFNVNNTPAVTQSGTWNVANLNSVVISSYAANYTPSVNITQVGTTTVKQSGTAGELLVSVQVAGDSNTFTGGLAHNGAAAATNRLGTTPAIVQTTPANGTALTGGRDAALSVGTDGNLWVSNQPAMRPASYYASVSSASYTTTTDLACLPGNATNTVIVRRIVVSCTETTAGQVTVSVIRRSAADSGGTSANMPVGKDDSTSGSAVSVPLVYSAAPTKGTFDSLADIQTIGCMASATASPNDVLVENWNDKAKVLRGTAQEFCVSLATPQDQAGTTVTGGNFNVHFEWNEITTITP